MIFSAQQIFSDDQAITATADSTNVIDLGVPGTPFGAQAALPQDIGKGVEIPVLAQITEVFDNMTSVKVQVVVSAAAALTSVTVLYEETIALADAIVGKQIRCRVISNEANLRFLGIIYTITGSAPSTGKFTSGITMGNQNDMLSS